MRLWEQTPLIPSQPLSAACGRPVWLKLEAVQPAGSFKQRGIGLRCQRAVAGGARRLIGSSGGNAGYAMAWVGRRLGVPVEVVVPEPTSAAVVARLEEEGAAVRRFGRAWDDAHAAAIERAAETGAALIHPFDHPDIWEGNATLVAEVVGALHEPPGLVVASVGGGGLLAGVLAGLTAAGWSPAILGCETEGTASFAAALAAGAPVTLDAVSGVATTLGSRRVCDAVVARAAAFATHASVVSDAAALDAARRFADAHRILVEPSCGAALAPVWAGALPGDGAVLVVVCGGAGATRASVG